MARVNLTDKYIGSLPPAPPGQRYAVNDSEAVPLALRVTSNGVKTFFLAKRPAGSDKVASVVIGKWPQTTLKAARRAVPGILTTLASGTTPLQVREEKQKEEARKRADSVDFAVDAFVVHMQEKKLRRWKEVAATLRRDFLGQIPTNICRTEGGRREWVVEWRNGPQEIWRGEPISKITRAMITGRVKQIKQERGLYAGLHALKAARQLFSWVSDEDQFGIPANPAARIKTEKALSVKPASLIRKRVLADDEMVRVWRAAEGLGRPWKELIWLLVLTGQRLNDVARARREELSAGLLTIPPERFKSETYHLVPLTTRVQEIIEGLPVAGPYLLSTTHGERPISGFSKMKAALDEALAKDGGPPVAHWILHDLRRSMRTGLGKCKINSEIAELVIGHSQKGLVKIYDQYAYLDEKRDAMQVWENYLLGLIEPREPTSNVVPIKAAAR